MTKKSYNDVAFWQQKYKNTICQHYQWLYTAKQIGKILIQQIGNNKQKRILQLGCGTSTLNQYLFTLGYKNIKSIDFSKEVIKNRLKKQKRSQYTIQYQCNNLTKLSDNNQSYDIIIDKCTFDCLFCDNQFIKPVIMGMRECYRLLNNNGLLLIISCGQPKVRKFLFKNKLVPFQLKYIPIKSNTKSKTIKSSNQEIHQNNYLYICKKGQFNNKNNQEQSHQDSFHLSNQIIQQDQNHSKFQQNQQISNKQKQQQQPHQQQQNKQNDENNEDNYEGNNDQINIQQQNDIKDNGQNNQESNQIQNQNVGQPQNQQQDNQYDEQFDNQEVENVDNTQQQKGEQQLIKTKKK